MSLEFNWGPSSSSSILHGEGPPTSDIGRHGQFYLDTQAQRLYGPKASENWGAGVVLIGAAGFTLLSGAEPPIDTDGVDGDFWINTAAMTIQGPKAAGAWPGPVSLVGPPGATIASGVAYDDTQTQLGAGNTQDALVALHTKVRPLLDLVPRPIADREYALNAADFGRVLLFTSVSPVRVLVPPGLGEGFNCRLVQGANGSVAVIAAGASVLSPGLRAATSEVGEDMTLLPIGPDAYQVKGSVEPSFYQRLDMPLIPADVAVVDAFKAAIGASGASVQAIFLPCLPELQAAITCVNSAARTATVIGAPIWTPYRGFGVGAITDALSVPGLSGGAWYTRRTDAVVGIGDRLGVAVYGVFDAGQQAAFNEAADTLLTAVGAKNTGRHYDTIAQVGSSLFANAREVLLSATQPEVRNTDRGELVWAKALMRNAFRLPTRFSETNSETRLIGGNFAIGGQGTGTASGNQVPYAIQSKAGWCAVETGRNDYNSGLTWDGYVWPTYREQILKPLLRAGMSLIHFGNFQRDSRSNPDWGPGTAKRIETQKGIDAYKPYVQSTGELFIDRYPVMTDPNALVPGDLYDGYTSDGIHSTKKAAYLLARDAILPVLAPVFGMGQPFSVYGAANLSNTSSVRAITTTAAAGTKSGPVGGVVPTGHLATQSATSNLTTLGGFVNIAGEDWWELTVTSAGVAGAAVEAFSLQSTYLTSIASTFGVVISWELQFENPDGLLMRFMATGEGGGSSGSRPRAVELYNSDVTTYHPTGNFSCRLVLDTQKTIAPAANTTRATLRATIDPKVAGVLKMRVRAFTIVAAPDPMIEFPVSAPKT